MSLDNITISKFIDVVSKLRPDQLEYITDGEPFDETTRENIKRFVLTELDIKDPDDEAAISMIVLVGDHGDFKEALQKAQQRYPKASPFIDSLLKALATLNKHAERIARAERTRQAAGAMTMREFLTAKGVPFWILDLLGYQPSATVKKGGGKKSRRKRTKRRRTIGGKKSRKQRKRTTLKGGKRKRRRTRRRR